MMVEGESVMITIQQRYDELKSEQELTDGIDKLIVIKI